MSDWVRVRLSEEPGPNDCRACGEPKGPVPPWAMTADREEFCYGCDMWINHYSVRIRRGAKQHARAEPIIHLSHDWRVCEHMISALKWRIKQVQTQGYPYTSKRNVPPPPPPEKRIKLEITP